MSRLCRLRDAPHPAARAKSGMVRAAVMCNQAIAIHL